MGRPEFDLTEMVGDAANEAAKSAIEETLKDSLVKQGFSALFVSVSAEVAKSIVGHLIGPMATIVFKIIDPTQRKLDAVLAEPFQSGIRSAGLAFSIHVGNEQDKRIRDEYLTSSLLNLEKAYSYSQTMSKKDECSRIRIAQALIAQKIGASGVMHGYLEEFRVELKRQLAFYEALYAANTMELEVLRKSNESVKTMLGLEDGSIEQMERDEVRVIHDKVMHSDHGRIKINTDNLNTVVIFGLNDDPEAKKLRDIFHREVGDRRHLLLTAMGVINEAILQEKMAEVNALLRFFSIASGAE
jgi:hypothetical protein